MATKTPSPYHADFKHLKFGTWSVSTGQFSGLNTGAASHPIMQAVLDQQLSSYEAKILFSGGGKVIYEFSYKSPAHPGSNKAKVEVPFSSIAAASFDQGTSTFSFTLSAPPATFVGHQAIKGRLEKERTVFQPQQVHLSPDGALKAAKTHTVTLTGSRQAATFKSKLMMDGRLARLLAAPPQQLEQAAVFSTEEVAASMGGKKRASGSGEASAPKRRAPAKTKTPNNTVLEAGWSAELPAAAGPWMLKSIERWGLQGPYLTNCGEEAWEAYYKERATLDFLTKAVSAGWLECKDDPYGEDVMGAAAKNAPQGDQDASSTQPELQDATNTAHRDQAGAAAGGNAHAQGAAGSTGAVESTGVVDEADVQKKDEQACGGEKAPKAKKAQLSEWEALVEELRWREEWAPPAGLKAFCREYYGEGHVWGRREEWDQSGGDEGGELKDAVESMRQKVAATLAKCSGVQGVSELAAAAGNSVYMLTYHVNWEDAGDPRSIDISARIYSPCGSPSAIDLHYDAHKRYRNLFAECCCAASVWCRRAELASPSAPQARSGKVHATELFSADLQDSGYAKRAFLGPQSLKDIQAHLFGRKGLVSERKMFNVLAAAAGAGQFYDTLTTEEFGVYRVIRRKHKRFEGEMSDANSDADADSGNEKLKNGRAMYPSARSAGFGFGGMGGYGDDESDGSEGADDGPPCNMM